MPTHTVDSPHPKTDRTMQEVQAQLDENNVEFLLLSFTDMFGNNKNVEVPSAMFAKALDGELMFDGSSIDGFVRIEESDMLLKPDFDTFRVFPWEEAGSKVARLICDVHNADGSPFEGCPRQTLKRQVAEAAELGYRMMVGPEAEFFLFQKDADGNVTTNTNDRAGYFDSAPLDEAESARRVITRHLNALGLEVEALHHEVAPGQHEIDFRYGDAINTADALTTFKYVVRRVAKEHGLHATFMPKPIYGINGSGMHIHMSMFDLEGKDNKFFDKDADHQISQTGLYFIGGIVNHARAICAVTNPTVNSFKRLVPGFEAPTHIAWSMRNRSPMIRIPDRRGIGTRMELRMPDPSCNPYLAFSVAMAAGLEGIRSKIDAPEPVNKNIYTMSARERSRLKIGTLPGDLNEAMQALDKDDVVKAALGEHIATHFLAAKRQTWQEYISQVHQWELDRYLMRY